MHVHGNRPQGFVRGTAIVLAALCGVVATPCIAQERGDHVIRVEPAQIEVAFPVQSSVVQIPFRNENGSIIIDVRINDTKTLPFIVDTGSPVSTVMRPEKLEGVKLNYLEAKGLGPHALQFARGVEFQIGDLKVSGMDLQVMPPGAAAGLGDVVEDAILGGQLFEHVVVEVNWKKSVLTLHDRSTFEPPADGHVMPLIRRRGYIYVNADVAVGGDHRSVEVIVDTGGSHALMVRSDRSPVPERRLKNLLLGQGLMGPVRGDIGRLDSVEFGPWQLSSVLTKFLDDSSRIFAVGSDGNLGNEILRRFNVTFDYPNSRMILVPTEAIAEPFLFGYSGIRLEQAVAADGTIGVIEVLPDSPASRAGIQVGDRITTLNSTPVKHLARTEISRRLTREAGIHVRVQIRRDGEIDNLYIKLADISTP